MNYLLLFCSSAGKSLNAFRSKKGSPQSFFKPYVLALITLLFLSGSGLIIAQSPYQLSTEVDVPTILSGTSLYTTSIILHRKSAVPGPEDMNKLDPTRLNFLDKIDPQTTRRLDNNAHQVSNGFLFGSAALPVLAPMLAGQESRHKMGVTYLIALEGILANLAITNLTKELAKRPRPFTFGRVPDEIMNKSLLYTKNSFRSFFSGHTSIAASNSFLAAKLLNDFYPDSKLKPAIWATAVVIPAITGYLRVKAGRHFTTDVLMGFIAGAAVGLIIPELHK